MSAVTRKQLPHLVVFFLLVSLLPAGPAIAGSIWTGTDSTNWSNASNWNGGVPANGDTLYFDLTQSTANLDTNNDMAGLTNLSFDIDKSGVTISGNAIGLGSAGVTANSLGSPTLNLDLSQPGDTTYTAGSSRTITLNGIVSGAGGVVKAGGGTLLLTGTNTYSGGTTVSAGILQGTTASLQGNITNNAAVTFDQGTDGTYAGILGGTGSLTKIGTGSVALTSANTYSGGTVVNGGTLSVSADNNLGTSAGGISFNGGALQFDNGFTSSRSVILNSGNGIFDTNGNNNTLTGIISGTGGFAKSGTGMMTLTGTNTYQGGTTVTAGILQGDTDSLKRAIVNNAAVVFDQGTDGTYAGAMNGTGSLTKSGAAILTLSGVNTYSGGTIVNAGTLQGNTSSLQGNIANNAAVVFDQAVGGTYAGDMSGTGSFTKNGAGILTLNGTNTYLGGTTVNTGTLQGTTASLQGTIANNAAVVFDQGADGTYAGAMNGTGSFTKSGTGTLILSGASTFSGLTSVNAGSLAVNGSLAGPVTVGAAGTLGGGGAVGNVTVSGSLAPGNSIGTINTGNLAFNAGSVYEVEVDAAGNSDRTCVTGTVSLGSAALNVLAQDGTYGYQTDYLIIDNDGADAITGTFGSLTSNLAFLDPTLAYTGGDGNDVILSLERNDVSFSDVATTPNQAAVADALEQMGSSATGDAQTIMNALAGLSATQACQAYTSMSPVGNAAFIDTSIAGMTQYMKTMTQHMGSIRTGISQGGSARSGDPVLLAAVETATVSDTAPPLFALGNASPLTPDKKWDVWGMGTGIWGDRKADNIASQYDYSLGGFSLGMERRLSDRFMTGVSVGYSHTNLAFDHLVNTGNADSYKMAIYGDYDAGPWYADAIISYATNDYDTERVITVGSLTRTATGNFTGKETSAYMEGGYEILYNRFHIQSLASLQLTHIALDDYTENGAGALNLAVGSKSTDSCLGSFGLRIFRPTKAASNLLLSPEARILWVHECSNDDRAINAGFAGVPASSFVVTGDKPVNDSVLFGLGLNALYKESFNLYLNYDVNLGRDHSQHALVAGMKYMWD